VNPLRAVVRANRGLRSRSRNIWFRLLGVRMSGYIWLGRVSIPRQWADITLDANVALDDGVVLLCSGKSRAGKLVIRSGTYVNRHTMFDVHERLEVGHNCMIGPACYLTDSDHGTAADRPVGSQPVTSKPVVLEDDVWLGAGVIVLSGVRVGRGAVVGAGAVVTKDVPANATVVGVPARVVAERQ